METKFIRPLFLFLFISIFAIAANSPSGLPRLVILPENVGPILMNGEKLALVPKCHLMMEKVTDNLVKGGKYAIMERKELNAVLNELGLGIGNVEAAITGGNRPNSKIDVQIKIGSGNAENAPKKGELYEKLNADYLVFISIDECRIENAVKEVPFMNAQKHTVFIRWTTKMRVVDAHTSRIITTFSHKGEDVFKGRRLPTSEEIEEWFKNGFEKDADAISKHITNMTLPNNAQGELK